MLFPEIWLVIRNHVQVPDRHVEELVCRVAIPQATRVIGIKDSAMTTDPNHILSGVIDAEFHQLERFRSLLLLSNIEVTTNHSYLIAMLVAKDLTPSVHPPPRTILVTHPEHRIVNGNLTRQIFFKTLNGNRPVFGMKSRFPFFVPILDLIFGVTKLTFPFP